MPRKIGAKRDTTVLDGAKVREIRISEGLRQEDLAAKALLSTAYISLIENQLAKVISLAAAQRIAQALGTETSELIADEFLTRRSVSHSSSNPAVENSLLQVVECLERSVDRLDRIADAAGKEHLDLAHEALGVPALSSGAGSGLASAESHDNGEYQTTERLIERAKSFILEGRYRQAADTYDAALSVAKSSRLNGGKLGEIYLGMIWPNYVLSDYQRCLSSAFEAVRVFGEEVGPRDRKGLARTYAWLAMIYCNMGDYELSLEYSAKSISQDAAACDAYRAAGIAKSSLGEWAEAESLLQKALKMATAAGEILYQGLVINNLVWLYIKEERLAEALDLCLEGLRLRQDAAAKVSERRVTQATRGIAYCHTNMADVFLLHKQWVLAEISLVTALELFTQIGDLRNAADQYYKFALLFLERDNNPEVARRFAQDYQDFFKGRPFRVDKARSKRLMGRVYSILGNSKAAERLLAESVQELRDIGNKYELGASSYELGLTEQALGEKEQASRYLREASSIFRELKVPRLLELAERAVSGIPPAGSASLHRV